jgi:hypothetical protein
VISRLPLTLRALVLVPLLAVGIDQLRVSFVCGPDVRSCLETAGNGRFGLAAMLILAVYAAAIATLVGKVAKQRPAPWLLWAVATAGVYALCGGQALLADIFGGGAMLGGGWFTLGGFGMAAGALIALALHVLPAARELIHDLAPKLRETVEFTLAEAQPPATPQLTPLTRSTRDRAPPALA